jgi:hypothetical protein
VADNITVTNGSYTAVIATKDIGGAHYEKIIVVDGSGNTVSGVAQSVNQGTAAAGTGAWPVSVTSTADTVVKPGDAVNNAVRVNIVAGAGSGGTAITDDSAFTVGSTPITPTGGIYRSVRDTVDDNDTGAFAMTQRRAQLVSIEDPDGDSAMDSANNAVRVNIVAGAAAGGTSMTDDSAFTPGASAVTPVGGTYRSVRDLVDDNDTGSFAMNQRRALLVQLEDSTGDSAMDDSNNAVRANVVASAAHLVDDAAFNVGTATITPVGGTYRSVRDQVDDNDAGALAMTQRRALLVSLEDGDGDSAMDATNNAVRAISTMRGAAKGATSTGDTTVSVVDADHNALDVFLRGSDFETASSALINAADTNATLAMAGKSGAHVTWDANNLEGTLVPEVSYETTASNWVAAQFLNQQSGVVELSYVGDGTNAAESKIIIWPGSVKHVRVKCSSYTTGTASITVHATNKTPNISLFTDDSNPRVPRVTNTTPGGSDYGIVVRLAGAGGTGTSMTDDGAFTVGTTTVTPAAGIYKSTLDNVDDGDAGALAMTQKRFLYTSPGTPNGDSAVDDAVDAIRTTPVTTVTVGGQSATATTTEFVNCAAQANLRTTAATTATLVAGVSAKLTRLCGMVLLADGDTDVSVVVGSDANCATGTTTILGPLDLTSTNGRGMIVPFTNVPFLDGVANANYICIQSTQAVNVTTFTRYAQF